MESDCGKLETGGKSASSFDLLRPLRIWVAIAWTAGMLSVAFLLIERQLRVVHLFSVPFIILLYVVFGTALGMLVHGFWRLLQRPRRPAAITWIFLGVLPALFWMALGWYGQRQWQGRNVPHNLPMILVRMAGASLMEAQARYLYPQRLETEYLVMYFGDGVTDPQADAEAMNQHVARLNELGGLTLRAKIWWVRGSLLGQGSLAIGGLALGSSKSPANHSDRHELAHAVLYQGNDPDTDPPTLLVEGWAEAQSVDSSTLAVYAADRRRHFVELRSWWEENTAGPEHAKFLATVVDPEGSQRLFAKVREEGRIDSYLRELTDPFWYHHDAGTVYPIGGAFVDFLIRRYGPQRFVKLYFTVRPGTFEADCQAIYGIELDDLETQFWEYVDQLVRESRQ